MGSIGDTLVRTLSITDVGAAGIDGLTTHRTGSVSTLAAIVEPVTCQLVAESLGVW